MTYHPKDFQFKKLEEMEFPCSPYTKCKGFTPLMVEIIHGKLHSYLLKECNINAQNEEGWNALMILARNSAPEPKGWGLEYILKLFLEKRSPFLNMQNSNGYTALMLASRHSCEGSTDTTVQLLLESGADPHLQNENGSTALMLVSGDTNNTSSDSTLELLLRHGAGKSINLQNRDGFTALMCAADNLDKDSRFSTLRLLLENGAAEGINIQNNGGDTALIIALNTVDTDLDEGVVKLFLEYGADPTIKDNDGHTAVYYCEDPGAIELLYEKMLEIKDKKIDELSLKLNSHTNNSETTPRRFFY